MGRAAAGVPNGRGMGMSTMEDEDEDDDEEDDEEDEEGGQHFYLPDSTRAPPVNPARVVLATCTGLCSGTVLHVHPALQAFGLRLS